MNPNDDILTRFQTRIGQLLLRFEQQREENMQLRQQVGELQAQISRLSAEVEERGKAYDTLKTARMLEITNKDLQGAKDRVARLIREVNKCITMLSEQ